MTKHSTAQSRETEIILFFTDPLVHLCTNHFLKLNLFRLGFEGTELNKTHFLCGWPLQQSSKNWTQGRAQSWGAQRVAEGMEAGAGEVSVENTELTLDGYQESWMVQGGGCRVTSQQGTQPFCVTGP